VASHWGERVSAILRASAESEATRAHTRLTGEGYPSNDFPANTDDVDWLPAIGAKGWVVVTGDRGISKKPAERKVLEEANVIAVFMAKGFTTKPIFDLVSLFIRWWPEIERAVGRVKPGTALEVNPNGKVDLL
jgi:hypothetical protein